MNTAREMKKQKTKKSNKAIRLFARIMGYLALIPAAIFSLTIACDIAISNSTSERIYDDIKDVPKYSTCVVLGTTPYSKGTKRGNPYFNNRMDAVAELYRRGGIKQIIVSGDSSMNYDETAKMSSALKKRGVPGKIIVRDTKGQNTLKSIKNVKEGFKVKNDEKKGVDTNNTEEKKPSLSEILKAEEAELKAKRKAEKAKKKGKKE